MGSTTCSSLCAPVRAHSQELVMDEHTALRPQRGMVPIASWLVPG